MRNQRLKMPSIQLYDTHGLSADTKQVLRMLIAAVMFGIAFTNVTTGAAWTGFQRALGANSLQMGIISAIPVAASTMQIFASYVLESRLNRRALLLVYGLIHRLCWVAIGLTPALLPESMGSARLYVVMAVLAVSSCCSGFLNVSFYSLVGDVVPMRIRGRFFSARQSISMFTGILTGLGVGLVMDRASGYGGYTGVLVFAGVCGSLDICCYFFMKWPPMQRRQRSGDTFGVMLREVLQNRPYMRIVGYFTLWFFAVNIMTPFFNVFLLEEIKMSYTEIAIYNQIITNAATIVVIGWWGRQMDRFGNQPVVQAAGLYCMILPLTYLLLGARSFLLLPLANVLSGMCWPASDLGQQNMYLAKAPARNRSMYVAVFFTCTQLFGTALSNFVGGALMDGPLLTLEGLGWAIGSFAMNRYDFLFALSALLRMGCVLVLLPRLREEGETPARQMAAALAREARESLRRRRMAARAARLRRRFRK